MFLLAVLQCTRASALFLYCTRLLHCERFATHPNQAGQLHQSSLATLLFSVYHMSNGMSLVTALFSTCGRLSWPDDHVCLSSCLNEIADCSVSICSLLKPCRILQIRQTFAMFFVFFAFLEMQQYLTINPRLASAHI